MKQSKTRLLAIFSLTFFVVSVGVLSWFVYQIVYAGDQLTQRIEAIALMNANLKTNAELEVLIEETVEERETLANLILTEEGTSVFLTDIEGVAQQIGVELSTRSRDVVEREEESYNALSLQLQIEGTNQQVVRMLEILEVLPYHSSVQSLRLTQEPGKPTQAEVGLMVTLKK